MITVEKTMESGVELVFAPDVELIAKIRTFVGELAGKTAASDEWVSQIELATHELVENAVKGASKGKVRMRVELHRGASDDVEIELRTWNRATAWNLTCLRKAIGEVATAPDPTSFYLDLMRRTAGQSGSGLGIGRVVAEAGMSVTCEVNGDEACVVARGKRSETR